MSDRDLWQTSRLTEADDDDAARFLDLAGFAESRLDPDEQERVAEWLAANPDAADDVLAARALPPPEGLPAIPEPAVARAVDLPDGETAPDNVVPFAPRRPPAGGVGGIARWGSLAAALAVASWLGFTLGVDTSRSFDQAGIQSSQASDDGFLRDLLDPSTGFLRDLTGGPQT